MLMLRKILKLIWMLRKNIYALDSRQIIGNVLYGQTNLKLIDFCGLIDISELRSEKVNRYRNNMSKKLDGEI